MRANDAIAGGVIIAFAAAMIAITFTFPPFPGQRYGPSLFPQILGIGLIVCGLILVRRGIAARRAGGAWVELAPWARHGRPISNVLVVLGAILAYILLADRIGFVLTAAAILLILFLWFRVRPLAAVLGAIIAVLFVDWFFGWMFRVPLPLGVLPNSPSAALSNLLRTMF
jgi:putative tricarboxylic transport membrane protein